MTDTRVSEAIARPLRTAPQGGAAWAITEGIDAFLWDMNERQYGVLVVLLTIAFSFIQTAVENGIGKAILRDVPPLEVPITSDDKEPGEVSDMTLGVEGDAEPLPEDDAEQEHPTEVNEEA